jgi:hypothetical protein
MAIFSMAKLYAKKGAPAAPLDRDANSEWRSVSWLVRSLLIAINAFHDFLLGFFLAEPAIDLDELARLEILVVGKEVGDLVKHHLRQIARDSMSRYIGVSLSTGTASSLASSPASSVMASMPIGRQRTTTPGGSANCVTTSTSTGSPSPAMVCGM